MTHLFNGELHVVVPVGFLLEEEQEVTVHVPRGEGSELPIRLKLVPARVPSSPPMTTSRQRRHRSQLEEEFPAYDLGVGD
ncbi:MAG: hypothetical protein WHU94_11950 [Thermogemmata sp.]|jgi:hypothetical protein|uniref:Uncharacterized protein n=1 Tax=Thermogemmata fonticola TaxID=2755323 RepID=A0A7V8VDE0_9BACT|nr:hypothetical protein [Thermogemmata fonticola]MBA2226018.1 hypothetical protein [Thermogemmata fonticola]